MLWNNNESLKYSYKKIEKYSVSLDIWTFWINHYARITFSWSYIFSLMLLRHDNLLIFNETELTKQQCMGIFLNSFKLSIVPWFWYYKYRIDWFKKLACTIINCFHTSWTFWMKSCCFPLQPIQLGEDWIQNRTINGIKRFQIDPTVDLIIC